MHRWLPERIKREKRIQAERSVASHRAWVRRHRCSVPGCMKLPIECAHVRRGADGGVSLKPSDRWCVSLCRYHHAEQHQLGEAAFEKKHGIDLVDLAQRFARLSPHWRRWEPRVTVEKEHQARDRRRI